MWDGNALKWDMSYLEYIPDHVLKAHVEHVIHIALEAQQKASDEFHKNVIDPFSAMFEMGGFKRKAKAWRKSELDRKAQKTVQNHVGEFHQKILGAVEGWQDLGLGGNVDLINKERRIIAEVKNKYNTVSGGKLNGVYDDLASLIMPKASMYHGFTAYFVNIIPKKNNIGSDLPFTPSDRAAGQRREKNDKIRIIDGRAFYALVTGRPDALEELYHALPSVVESILANKAEKFQYSKSDIAHLNDYYAKAFVNKC